MSISPSHRSNGQALTRLPLRVLDSAIRAFFRAARNMSSPSSSCRAKIRLSISSVFSGVPSPWKVPALYWTRGPGKGPRRRPVEGCV
jgi:hypothetical protein